MKKSLIIIGLGIILIILWVVLKPQPEPIEDTVSDLPGAAEEALTNPADIIVGVYDPNEAPDAYSTLLIDHMKTKGFKVQHVREIPDPDALNQESSTVFYRTNTKDKLKTLENELFNNTLYRQGLIDTIEQDLIIGVWNIEEIDWGDNTAAEAFLHPDPASIAIAIVNAGAESGTAGNLAETLEGKGYGQIEVSDAEVEATRPLTIFYQRHFREAAKDLRLILKDLGYESVTYRSDLALPVALSIELGPADDSDETVVEDVTEE